MEWSPSNYGVQFMSYRGDLDHELVHSECLLVRNDLTMRDNISYKRGTLWFARFTGQRNVL
jgi:hypothetical protein